MLRKTPMKILYSLLMFCFVHQVYADQPRMTFSFKSKNERFELRPCDTIFSDNKLYTDSIYNSVTKNYQKTSYSYPDRYYWGLYDKQTDQKLYTIKNDSLFIEMRTAVISDDGQNIIIIDDFSGAYGIKQFEMVTFYQRDELIKILTLGDLLDSMCSVTYSTSHMRWCSYFGFNDKEEFTIKTYEFYHYTFNKKGILLHRQSDALIGPDDTLADGKIKRIKRNRYQIKIDYCIRGNLKAEEILEVQCKDSAMKKIYGRLYGFLKSRKKALKKEFTRTFLIKNGSLQMPNFAIPIYNSPNHCNRLNSM